MTISTMKRRIGGAVGLTIALAWLAPAGALTLAGVLGAPFPSELTAAHHRPFVAWVSNERGVRNILLAEPHGAGGYATRSLTAFTQDDGFELDHLDFADGDRRIVYTGGGSLEGGGPVNTMSLAAGPVVKHVYAVGLGDPHPRDLGAGEAPTASPTGDRVAFVRDGQIWAVALGTPAAATQWIHDRGSASTLGWSPDGTRLAFVSHRKEGHALLGIYDVASGAIRWMAPSVDRDVALAWSPDGRRIAWVRTPTTPLATERSFAPKRGGPPWALWIGDPATGEGHAIWHADPGPGSVFKAIEDGSRLFWSADDRLVFPWEKSGWIRLYALGTGGGAPVALTADGAEVFAARLDGARTGILFTSNAGDDDHRHLWRVATAGGDPHPLTRGDSIEDLPAATRDGAVFVLHGSGRDPLEPVALAAGGALQPLYLPADRAHFPRAELVVPQRVVFDSSDGKPVHGQLFLPPAGTAGKHPAILFFHGGPQRQMLLGWHPMGAYTHLYAMNQYLASQGYIVMSVNYRGGTGYGLDWREPLEFAEAGGSEVRDIAGAARYLRGRRDVDTARIGVYGMSYGGVMTSLALSKLPQEFAAGVDIAGVHDWKSFLPYLTKPGAPPEPAELAFRSSAVSSAKDWRAPVLLMQGDDDRAVDFSQSIELVQALRAAGRIEPEQYVIPNEVHDFIRHQSWMTVLDRTQAFLMRELMQRKTGQ